MYLDVPRGSNKYTCRIWSFKSWLRVRTRRTLGATFEAPDPAGVYLLLPRGKHSIVAEHNTLLILALTLLAVTGRRGGIITNAEEPC